MESFWEAFSKLLEGFGDVIGQVLGTLLVSCWEVLEEVFLKFFKVGFNVFV